MFSDLYDKKYFSKCLMWSGIVFGLMNITGGAGFAVVIPIVLYCILARNTEALLFWLLVAICSVIANPNLVPKGGGYAWMQRGLLVFLGGIMAINVMAYPLHNVIRPYVGMIFYVLFMAISSLYGWNPKISYLKLILFFLIYFSYIGVSNQVGINPQVSSRKIRSILLSIAVLFVFGSMALVPFPGISQLKAEDFIYGNVDMSTTVSLFVGMANHSQCLGPVITSISIILWGDLLFSIRRFDLLYMSLLICCPYLIYLTSSRTGMGAYLVGQLFVLWIFINAQFVGSRWKSRVMTIAMLLLTLLLIIIMCVPSVHRGITRFAVKSSSGSNAHVSAESVISSRMALIDSALYNFKKSPLLGNGFQVSEEMKYLKTKGFAVLSAPIEKGVWVTAVLEEGGIIGMIIFSTFLLVCILKSIKQRAYIGASCLFVCTMINLGEFTFFSMSYSGGFCWAMVFMGLALDLRKMNDENEALRQQIEFEQMQMEMMEGAGNN